MNKKSHSVGIAPRINQALEEIRVITPGTQALLGFQLAAIFQTGFEKISQELQRLHFFSLISVLISIMFLILAPAYHRIVEEGENTERFHSFASKMILFALTFLTIGIAIELYVISQIIFRDFIIAFTASVTTFTTLVVVWFGFNLFVRVKESN